MEPAAAWQPRGVPVLEHAILPVRPGAEADFEAAFETAAPLIASSPGFVSLRLERSLEHPSTYLLLVEWETLEAHTVGFRQGPDYARWSELLHHFYDPFPVVEHFVPAGPAGPPSGRAPSRAE